MNVMDNYSECLSFVKQYNGDVDDLFKLMINQLFEVIHSKISNKEFDNILSYYAEFMISLIKINILLIHTKEYNHQYDELLLHLIKTVGRTEK